MTRRTEPVRSAWRRCGVVRVAAAFLLMTGVTATLSAQQLEPRAYSPSPIGTNIVGLSYTFSKGGVLTDPSLPLANVNARFNLFSPYYARSFGLFGRLASVSAVIPYGLGSVSGDVMETHQTVNRSGLGDPQLRFAINLLGGPALTLQQFSKRRPETTLGFSLTVVCPWGQYFPSKLINIGTNRWAAKPELGFSQPAGKWTFEVYAGVWFFAENSDFFGGVVRSQKPLGSYQTHIVYNVNPAMWAAFDFTYYNGGQSTIGGLEKQDRQDNTRGGLTFVVPIAPGQSIKIALANGVTARIGSKFQTIGVAWQYVWFDRSKPAGMAQ